MFRLLVTTPGACLRNNVLTSTRRMICATNASRYSVQRSQIVRNYYPKQHGQSRSSNRFVQLYGKPTLFTLGGIGCIYTLEIVIQEEKLQHASRQFPRYFNRAMSMLSTGGDWKVIWRRYEMMKMEKLKKENSLWSRIKTLWYSLDEYYRCVGPIVLINFAVFLSWKSPRYVNILRRHFVCTAESLSLSSLLLSTFSHKEFWHFTCNMIGLVSFGRGVYDILGCEQFHAFYLSAGLFSSYVSYLAKLLFRTAAIGSLGASGAVYSVMALATHANPDMRMMLIFLPFFSFSAQTGLLCLVLFDLFGMVFRVTPFDHAAHLGGAFFGYFYSPIREVLWKQYRQALITRYRRLRKRIPI